jgi:hypothetical protein
VGAGRGQFDAVGAAVRTSHVLHHTPRTISSGFLSRPIFILFVFEGVHCFFFFNIPQTNAGAISHVAEESFCPFHRLTHFEALYRGAGNSLARPGRKQATAIEDFDVHVSYLLS